MPLFVPSVPYITFLCPCSPGPLSHIDPQTLLPAASLLQLNGVRDACCKFLLSQLDPSNCLGIRGFADTHSCSDLLKAAHRYVLQHFVDVAKTEEFMLLPLKQVTCQPGHSLDPDPALSPWPPSPGPLRPGPLLFSPYSQPLTHVPAPPSIPWVPLPFPYFLTVPRPSLSTLNPILS